MCCLLKRAWCLLHIVAREANGILKVSVFPGETLMIFAIETQNTTHSDSGDFLALQRCVTLLNYLCDRLANPVCIATIFVPSSWCFPSRGFGSFLLRWQWKEWKPQWQNNVNTGWTTVLLQVKNTNFFSHLCSIFAHLVEILGFLSNKTIIIVISFHTHGI